MRVAHHKGGSHQVFGIINFRTGDQVKGRLVDDNLHLVGFDHLIVFVDHRIEIEFVLKPRAPTTGHGQPQHQGRIAFGIHQKADTTSGRGADRQGSGHGGTPCNQAVGLWSGLLGSFADSKALCDRMVAPSHKDGELFASCRHHMRTMRQATA